MASGIIVFVDGGDKFERYCEGPSSGRGRLCRPLIIVDKKRRCGKVSERHLTELIDGNLGSSLEAREVGLGTGHHLDKEDDLR